MSNDGIGQGDCLVLAENMAIQQQAYCPRVPDRELLGALVPCDPGNNFHRCDLSNRDTVSSTGYGNGTNPGGPLLDIIALEQGTTCQGSRHRAHFWHYDS